MFFEPAATGQLWTDALNTQVKNGLGDIANTAAHWVIPIAAVGSVSMAVIQAVKNQTPVRNWYQRYRIRRWILASIRENYSRSWFTRVKTDLRIRFSLETKARTCEKKWLTSLEQKLILLCTSGDTEAFYDLPIDGLCDQIRKVISVIIDNPGPHKDLLALLARGASAEDIRLLLNAQEADPTGSAPPPPSKDEAALQFRQFTAAKSRVLSQTRCSVDALQIAIGFRWKFWLQTASMVLSIVIGAVAFDLGAVQQPSGATNLMKKYWDDFSFGVLAGVLAPIARDLVATVEKWRS
jgi:hypothetical protein